MSQKVRIDGVRHTGASVFLGVDHCGNPCWTRNPERIMAWLCDGWRVRFNQRREQRPHNIPVKDEAGEIVDWARGPMAHLHAGTLDDPRVSIHVGDVGGLIRSSAGRFDAILLDVDNGPDGLSREGNDALYTAQGLQQARAALGPGGVLAVWSSGPDPRFTSRLRKASFAVEEEIVPARRTGGGARHTIWLAQRR